MYVIHIHSIFLTVIAYILWLLVISIVNLIPSFIVSCIFLTEQQLICVDLLKLHGVHAFINDDGQRRSWIDHVVEEYI